MSLVPSLLAQYQCKKQTTTTQTILGTIRKKKKKKWNVTEWCLTLKQILFD